MSRESSVCGVYCWSHLPTGRKYVGSSVDCLRRRKAHLSKMRGCGGTAFHREAQKLGFNFFCFGVVEECSPDVRFLREKFWLMQLSALWPTGFNSQADPDKGYDYQVSDATRRKLSRAREGKRNPNFGKKHTLEARGRISAARLAAIKDGIPNPFLGKKHSEETKKKLSESARGRVASPEARKKMSEAGKGRVLSESHRARLALANRGRVQSEEAKRKISLAHRGKTISEEHRQKIIASNKRRGKNK